MENEELVKRLKQLLEFTETADSETRQQSEKFQIALSNTLRLTESGSTTLSKLRGTPEDLTAYLIRLSSDLCSNFQEQLDHMSMNVREILNLLQQP